jgi:hypothetical protein
MMHRPLLLAALLLGISAAPLKASPVGPTPSSLAAIPTALPVQYWRGPPGGWGPGWRPGPRWYGRPYWYARPWARRPYYGTVIAGVALGTIIGVAAVGLVPPRPAPNLCWYWTDPYRTRGYWDYCY